MIRPELMNFNSGCFYFMAERQPGEVLILLSRVMKKKRKRRKK